MPHETSADASTGSAGVAGNIPVIEMVLVDGGTLTVGRAAERSGGYDDDDDDYDDDDYDCDDDDDCDDGDYADNGVSGGNDAAGKAAERTVATGDFYIQKHEVTQGLWESVMGNNPSKFTDNKDLPVESVSWDDAREFIRKLNEKTGEKYRLPTEAEWEYAARGGRKSKGREYAGSWDIDDVAWYDENSGYKTHRVGRKAPNELGLYDMTGNVWEWVDDGTPADSAQRPDSMRVSRGGSWIGDAKGCRISARDITSSGTRIGYLGFRLAMSMPEPADVPVEMVFVKGGMLTGENGDVAVDDFFIGKVEVTQGQWKAVMGRNPSKFTGNDSLPVEKVNWNDVQRFIEKLNERTGKKYRLPNEDEWEFAARGGNESKGYEYSGGNNLDDVAHYVHNSGAKTHVVGSKRPNELGIHDMSGNVREWTSGYYDWGTQRVIRGGGWGSGAKANRVTHRDKNSAKTNGDGLGFRLALSAPPAEPPPEAKPIPKINVDMVLVEGGKFTMGCPDEKDKDCGKDEMPAHEVTLNSFHIGKYELTQAQWKAVMAGNRSEFKGDDRPVERVSWDEAQEFIRKLNEHTGKNYRLPTEAEWEFAARGGKKSKGHRYSGGDSVGAVAWYGGNGGGETHPVGTKQANELGLHDMSGNVNEWVNDWKGDYWRRAQENPKGPESGKERVIRGGEYSDKEPYCRVTSRMESAPFSRGYKIGFRLAHDADPPAKPAAQPAKPAAPQKSGKGK
jgi:formylglycine-generating enzyme required for sulfatase activity